MDRSMNNRFPPRELFWQHYQLTERDVKHGDLIFDSDKLLFPVKQYLYLFDIDAFDEYALVAYNFLRAQAEMYEEKLDLLVDSNRITRDFRIRVFYDKNTWGGQGWTRAFQFFKENGNDVYCESLLSQINARFFLTDAYITDREKANKWIEAYCRYIMYTAIRTFVPVEGDSFVFEDKSLRSKFPFQVRKFAANWMRDIHEFTDKDYEKYFKIEIPGKTDEVDFLVKQYEKVSRS